MRVRTRMRTTRLHVRKSCIVTRRMPPPRVCRQRFALHWRAMSTVCNTQRPKSWHVDLALTMPETAPYTFFGACFDSLPHPVTLSLSLSLSHYSLLRCYPTSPPPPPVLVLSSLVSFALLLVRSLSRPPLATAHQPPPASPLPSRFPLASSLTPHRRLRSTFSLNVLGPPPARALFRPALPSGVA